MSDLTRVLEWMERRQGKKKQALQVCTVTENLQGGLHSGQLKPDGMGRGAGLQHRGERVLEGVGEVVHGIRLSLFAK